MNEIKEDDSQEKWELTKSAFDYFQMANKNLKMFLNYTDAVTKEDFLHYIIEQKLNNKPIEIVSPEELCLKKPGARTLEMREYTQEFIEMFLVRSVDNFQSYIVDIIREVLKKKPELLRNRKQTLTLDEILSYNSIEDLIGDIIESKVNSLSYEGFGKLEDWFISKGIPLKVEKEQRNDVVEIIALRNIIAHNRGFVDKRYLQNVRNSSFRLGDKRIFSFKDLNMAGCILDHIVDDTDKVISEKFKLNTMSFEFFDFRG